MSDAKDLDAEVARIEAEDRAKFKLGSERMETRKDIDALVNLGKLEEQRLIDEDEERVKSMGDEYGERKRNWMDGSARSNARGQVVEYDGRRLFVTILVIVVWLVCIGLCFSSSSMLPILCAFPIHILGSIHRVVCDSARTKQ